MNIYFFEIFLLLLVGVEYLEEGLVDVGLVVKAALDLVHVVDGVAELDLARGRSGAGDHWLLLLLLLLLLDCRLLMVDDRSRLNAR